MNPGRVGVVLVNYDSSHLLGAALPVAELDNARVVVVDNFSSEAERRQVATLSEQRGWELVLMPDNRGFGAGVNAGVRRARELNCECYLLLNPDARIEASVVESLRRAVVEEPLALVSPLLVDRTGAVTSSGSILSLVDGANRRRIDDVARGADLEWLTAACLAVHDQLWSRTSGFDESYFMYWEDVDFNWQCREVGGTVLLRDDLTVIHERGGTQGDQRGRAKSELYYFHNTRNRLLFASRHLSRRALVRWMVRTPRAGWQILLRGGRRQLLVSYRPASAVVRGSVSGLWSALRALAGPHVP